MCWPISGIEVAGLVLGAIPLVISALEHYAEGVDTVRRWWRYKRELNLLAVLLGGEHACYIGSCERLLRDIVPTQEWELLKADPGGPQWRNSVLEDKLRERLGDAFAAYFNIVKDIASELKDMQRMLKLDDEMKVGVFLGIFEYAALKLAQVKEPSAHTFEEEFRAIKFSLSKRRIQDSIERMKHDNMMLWRLTTQNMELEPISARQGQHIAKGLAHI